MVVVVITLVMVMMMMTMMDGCLSEMLPQQRGT